MVTHPPAIDSILIVRLSAIGDCVHALPVARALRRAYPKATIGWAIQRAGADVVSSLQAADHYHLFPRELRGLARWRALAEFGRRLRSQRYSVAVDLQGNSKSGLVSLLSGARQRIGLPRAERRELNAVLVPLPRKPRRGGRADESQGAGAEIPHVIERNLRVLEQLGLHGSMLEADGGFRLPLTAAGEGGASDVVLCPGTTWVTKIWPAERYAQLAAVLAQRGRTVEVFWGNRQEQRAAEQITAKARAQLTLEGAERVAMSRPLTLTKLAEYLSSAQLVVGNDSGPVHLAAALGVPCVAIYGASDPRRNGPYWPGTRSVWVDDADLACRPCWRRTCARGDLACLERVQIDRVLSACCEVDPSLRGTDEDATSAQRPRESPSP